MPLAVEWTNLHQILRSLYADMLPLCSDMMGIAKGLAGLGALFFIAYRVWKSLAAAEPIEVFPLLRPFVLGLCILGVGFAFTDPLLYIMGSTETTFYTIAVYFGAVGITRTRYAVPAALCADLTGFLAAAWAVRLLFP